jgi:hypothetical protein
MAESLSQADLDQGLDGLRAGAVGENAIEEKRRRSVIGSVDLGQEPVILEDQAEPTAAQQRPGPVVGGAFPGDGDLSGVGGRRGPRFRPGARRGRSPRGSVPPGASYGRPWPGRGRESSLEGRDRIEGDRAPGGQQGRRQSGDEAERDGADSSPDAGTEGKGGSDAAVARQRPQDGRDGFGVVVPIVEIGRAMEIPTLQVASAPIEVTMIP